MFSDLIPQTNRWKIQYAVNEVIYFIYSLLVGQYYLQTEKSILTRGFRCANDPTEVGKYNHYTVRAALRQAKAKMGPNCLAVRY